MRGHRRPAIMNVMSGWYADPRSQQTCSLRSPPLYSRSRNPPPKALLELAPAFGLGVEPPRSGLPPASKDPLPSCRPATTPWATSRLVTGQRDSDTLGATLTPSLHSLPRKHFGVFRSGLIVPSLTPNPRVPQLHQVSFKRAPSRGGLRLPPHVSAGEPPDIPTDHHFFRAQGRVGIEAIDSTRYPIAYSPSKVKRLGPAGLDFTARASSPTGRAGSPKPRRALFPTNDFAMLNHTTFC